MQWLPRISPGLRGVAVALLSLSLTGCVSEGDAYLVEGAPSGAQLKRLVLVPMNFDWTPPSQLAGGTEVLQAEVSDYLRETGHEIPSVSLWEVLRHWRAAVDAVGGVTSANGKELLTESYEAARQDLARRLLAKQPADGVVMPTLLVREGRYVGRQLRWDGVGRHVELTLGPGAPPQGVWMRGGDRGTSLRVTVYDGTGKKIFERFAGLEVMRRYRVSAKRVAGYERTDLFQDPEIIEEGVVQAFSPWIQPAQVASK